MAASALEIATTAALDPELMLLDEPTHGLGREDVDRVMQLIKKGRLENGVGYVKKDFLNGAEFLDFSAVNPAAAVWLATIANVRIHGETHQRPVDLFKEGQPHLRQLNPLSYDIGSIKSRRASKQFRVAVDTNHYSVPAEYASQRVTIKAAPDWACIYHQDKLIARHVRRYDRHQDCGDPDHPQALLDQRHNADEQRLLKQFLSLSRQAQAYVEGTEQRRVNLRHHLRKTVALSEICGVEAVDRPIQDGIAFAAFFAIAALPTFLLLRTAREASRFPDMARFMVCLLFYQSGVVAAIALAAIYAQQAIGFTAEDNIKLFFVVNGTAAVGAFAFGYMQDRLGHVRTIAVTLVGWLLMTAVALGSETREQFWVAANIAGLCLGFSQSAARALVGHFAPARRRAEFFGLWGLAMKMAAIAGPMTYGITTWISGGNHRLALAITGLYFVAGLLLLIGIDERRGREAALAP